jgi:hypothetical protein
MEEKSAKLFHNPHQRKPQPKNKKAGHAGFLLF